MRREVFLPAGIDTLRGHRSRPGKIRGGAVREQIKSPSFTISTTGAARRFTPASMFDPLQDVSPKNHLPDQKAILPDAAIDRMDSRRRAAYAIGWDIRRSGGTRWSTRGMGGVRTTLDFERPKISRWRWPNSSTGLVDEIITIFRSCYP